MKASNIIIGALYIVSGNRSATYFDKRAAGRTHIPARPKVIVVAETEFA
jgi:hypothetical protein